MATPRFKLGDTVQWGVGDEGTPSTIVDGPFAPGARFAGQDRGSGWPNEFTYVILFSRTGQPQLAKLVGEGSLTFPERWVDCPGEHQENPQGCVHRWKRRVP